jgi:hypothetical protein
VRKLPAVTRIPIIREFLVSAAACILRNELSVAYAPAGNDVEREPENAAVAN